jgi:hypothetical protein
MIMPVARSTFWPAVDPDSLAETDESGRALGRASSTVLFVNSRQGWNQYSPAAPAMAATATIAHITRARVSMLSVCRPAAIRQYVADAATGRPCLLGGAGSTVEHTGGA